MYSGPSYVLTMYQHDTLPDLECTVTGIVDGVEGPVPWANAASVKVIAEQHFEPLFSRPLTTGMNDGTLVLQWQEGDTALIGPISLEFEVTWASGRIQTFRCPVTIDVRRDLG